MRLVRAVETEIESLHRRGRMSGSFHSSVGQEGCAVGVCAVLRRSDIVTSTHRGHGHALAKGVPVEGIFAELFGRRSGVSGGRGGSMHLHHRASGFYGQNAIVGGGLPSASGAAWARRRRGGDDVAVAFMGDGAFAQGITHETLLLARHWRSPCIVVCENNGLAHSMLSEALFGDYGSIARAVTATGMLARYVDEPASSRWPKRCALSSNARGATVNLLFSSAASSVSGRTASARSRLSLPRARRGHRVAGAQRPDYPPPRLARDRASCGARRHRHRGRDARERRRRYRGG